MSRPSFSESKVLQPYFCTWISWSQLAAMLAKLF